MMRVSLGLALAGLIAASAVPAAAQDEEEDYTVECSSLEKIRIAAPESYDEHYCLSGRLSGLSSGERRGPVGGPFEVIVAYNRATFAIIRFDGTNHNSYLKPRDLEEVLSNMMVEFEPKDFGPEQRHDRFKFARLQAKVADDSPFLNCTGFLSYQRPAPGATGYREMIAGLYCAMDTLEPTDAEIAEFLDGLTF